MRQRTIPFAISVALVSLLAAQAGALDFDQKQFYGQGVVALPLGDFGDLAKLGFGAGLGMLVPHDEALAFRGEVSFLYFLDDVEGDVDVTLWQVPVQALVQYSFTDSPAYLLGGLGLAFTHFEVGSFSNTETDVALALGGGYKLKPNMVLEGRFNVVSDANSISAHFGFHF